MADTQTLEQPGPWFEPVDLDEMRAQKVESEKQRRRVEFLKLARDVVGQRRPREGAER